MRGTKAKNFRKIVKQLLIAKKHEGEWAEYSTDPKKVKTTTLANGEKVATGVGTITLDKNCGRKIYQNFKRKNK